MEGTAAALSLEDGCMRLGLPKQAALELLQFLSCKRLHDELGLSRAMSPSSSLERLWDWMSCNTQALEVVGELVGGPVEHPGQEQDGLSDADLLLQRLYAVNIIVLTGHQAELGLWQEPGQPPISTTGQPGVFTSPALSARQQQQLADDLQAYHTATAAASNEVSVPFGQPWKISVSLGATSYRPVQTYAIRAVDGLTVREFKRELLRQSCTGMSPMELRVFDGKKELFDSMCVPHVSALCMVPPGQLFC